MSFHLTKKSTVFTSFADAQIVTSFWYIIKAMTGKKNVGNSPEKKKSGITAKPSVNCISAS